MSEYYSQRMRSLSWLLAINNEAELSMSEYYSQRRRSLSWLLAINNEAELSNCFSKHSYTKYKLQAQLERLNKI
jgi:hypothetical protein